jgi:hypothetical protein
MDDSQLSKETIEGWLGPAGSRLQRLPRARQVHLRKWLTSQDSGVLTAESRLRVVLAAGAPIDAMLIESTLLTRTLAPDDLLRFATRLSTKRPTIDAESFLLGLIESVRAARSRMELKELRRIIGGLHKWSRWVCTQNATLSAGTGRELASLLSLLVRRLPSSKASTRGATAHSNVILKQLLSNAQTLVQVSHTVDLTSINLDILLGARLCCREEALTEILQEEMMVGWVKWLEDGISGAIEDLATRGNSDRISEITAQCGVLPRLEKVAKEATRSVLAKGSSMLSTDVQRWLQRFLGMAPSSDGLRIEHASGSERPEISQLALALLRTWDAKGDSRHAQEAHETLKDVCEKFFNLRLRGDVGSKAEPDSRLFQMEGGSHPGGTFVIRRPWIEWRDEDAWKVVLRGIIAKA